MSEGGAARWDPDSERGAGSAILLGRGLRSSVAAEQCPEGRAALAVDCRWLNSRLQGTQAVLLRRSLAALGRACEGRTLTVGLTRALSSPVRAAQRWVSLPLGSQRKDQPAGVLLL